jgi:hypothetical protein
LKESLVVYWNKFESPNFIKELIIVILILALCFSLYSNLKNIIPTPRILTHLPYAGMNKRGLYVTGFTYSPVNLKEPVPFHNVEMAISIIEHENDLTNVILLCKLEIELGSENNEKKKKTN